MTNPQFLAIANALGWTLVHSLWQIALVALLLKGALMLSSNQSARLRYGLSLTAMLVLALGSVLTFCWSYHPIVPTMATGNLMDLEATTIPFLEITDTKFEATLWEVWLARLEQALPYLAMAWLIGIFVTSFSTVQGYFQLRRLQSRYSQPVSEAWQARLQELQNRIGIQRKVQLLSSTLLSEPITFRHFKPVILLPASLLTGLTAEQIEILLLHELAHIRRYDYLVNWAQSGLEVLFFYHPAFWWISRQVRAEREHCCDDLVMRVVQQPMLYAQTLTQLQLNFHSLKTNLAMSATKNQGVFTTRIHRLFGKYSIPNRPRRGAILALLLVMSVMAWAFYVPSDLGTDFNKSNLEQTASDSFSPQDIRVLQPVNGKLKLVHEADISPSIYINGEASTVAALEQINSTEVAHIASNTKQVALFTKDNPDALNKGVRFPDDTAKLLGLGWDEIDEATRKRMLDAGRYATYMGELPVEEKEAVSELYATLDGLDESIESWKNVLGEAMDVVAEEIEFVEYHEGAEVNEDGNYEIFKADKVTLPASKSMGDFVSDSKNEQMLLVANGGVWEKLGNNAASDAKLDELNRQHIETVNIRGGDEAVKQYGEQAANGVIEIVTKAGKLLEGKKAGVSISNQKSSDIVLKSTESDTTKQPLFVIDGEIVEEGATKDLDPDDIATINVLKDEAAFEKYGEKGRNGVVEITTKKSAEQAVIEAPSFRFEPLEKGSTQRPLLVINGEIIEDDRELDPKWVKKVKVLKGKEATDKYGTRGKHGVIEVKWKTWNEFKKDHPPRGMVLNGAVYDNMDTEEESLRYLGLDTTDYYQRKRFLEPKEAMLKYGEAGKGGIWEFNSDHSMLDIEYPEVGLAPDMVALEGNPLLIVDGEYIDYGDDVKAYIDANIKPRQIEKINIWKGKDATERYGKKGENGVIQIFTKAGSKRKARLEVQLLAEAEKVRFIMEYDMNTSGTFSLYDPSGKKIPFSEEMLGSGNTADGAMYFDWSSKGKPAGIYTTQLEANGKLIEKQFRLDKQASTPEVQAILDTALEQIGEDAVVRSENRLNISPNPATDVINIRLFIPKSSSVDLNIVDINGKEIKRFPNSFFSEKEVYFEGKTSFDWQIGNTPKGTYFAVLNVDGEKITKQFVVQ